MANRPLLLVAIVSSIAVGGLQSAQAEELVRIEIITELASTLCNQQNNCPPPLDYVCSDRIDNDGDGATDFPADTGCMGPTDDTENEACNDGIDNDGDGATDSGDPGCSAGTDQSEQDATIEYDDGLDNDADGLTDGSDPWCSSLADDAEAGPSSISNGGFEIDSAGTCPPTGWTYYEYNSGTDCVVSSPVTSGSRAVEIYDGSTSLSAGITSTCIEVHPGETVTAIAWFRGKSPPDSNAHFNLYLEFFDTTSPSGSGSRIAVEAEGWAASSTTWDDKSVAKVAPANSVCAWVLLYSPVGANGTYYVDDVSLTAT